ncbi:complement C1q subcomponent subunit B-like [Saccostrea echinata]|uniref:complement C1q subcomponent subunit B-like n=1 Tax=Saccostrea echinata TaxID=191078 RepID=UPI002A81F9A0|nr:complement C1q subcomponent subunit B-like [Saccostrea echinata]
MQTNYVVFYLILVLNFCEGSTRCATCRKPVVAFTAKLSKDTLIRGHDVVKYDQVLTNWGGTYNPRSGIFTAPYDGLYTISCTLMSHSTNDVLLKIVKNGKKMSKLYSASKTFPQSGQIMHLLLNKGDRVWIQNDNTKAAKLHDHGSYNLFSVLLITDL